MTAKELLDSVGKARSEEFPGEQDVEVFPSKYYNSGVRVVAPNGTSNPRAARYCATTLAAKELAQVLGAKAILLGSAMNFTGLLFGWQDTEFVPYLVFVSHDSSKDTKPINAGLLLDYFNHSRYPATIADGERAIQHCMLEIQEASTQE